MSSEDLLLDRKLRQEILLARERVYRFGSSTPLEKLNLQGPGPEIWVKREDLCAVKSYKWRGACNRMAVLSPRERKLGVATASAGNHAQGVALAARTLGIRARIHMPRSTPRVKQDAVFQHGSPWVEIHLSGDAYDDAVQTAVEDADSSGATYIHAYDDLQVMAGQGTLADEIVLSGKGPFDAAFLQIGGGGLTAGVSTWLKTYWPDIHITGVEGNGQASMEAALAAGEPISLDQVDLFRDGTAVRKAGSLPFRICKDSLDGTTTVSNEEVCHAIRMMWEGLRCIAEPAGALGLAGAMKHASEWADKKVLMILCGANIDFLQIGNVTQAVGASNETTHTLQIELSEQPGSMLNLLDRCFEGANITDFQYGKTDRTAAQPVFSVSTSGEHGFESLRTRLTSSGFVWKEITNAVDVRFRAIPLRADLLRHPAFLRLDFYERPGALHDFLAQRVHVAINIVYFNYRQSGERIGRALIGLDFASTFEREAFLMALPPQGEGYRLCEPVPDDVALRLLGKSPERA